LRDLTFLLPWICYTWKTVQADQAILYSIWAADNVVYGPVELPALVSWVKDERVVADTWVYDNQNDRWRKAAKIPELQLFFRTKGVDVQVDKSTITPGILRRVKALADLTDEQLERFVHFMEPQTVRQWAHIVKQGEMDNGMYLVLEGELRVRLMIGGKETVLATLGAGECFGEMALFDQGPRSADVLSNKDSVLLKITAEAFERLRQDAPELSAPILFSISKTLAARIRADNKRIKDSVNFARAAGA